MANRYISHFDRPGREEAFPWNGSMGRGNSPRGIQEKLFRALLDAGHVFIDDDGKDVGIIYQASHTMRGTGTGGGGIGDSTYLVCPVGTNQTLKFVVDNMGNILQHSHETTDEAALKRMRGSLSSTARRRGLGALKPLSSVAGEEIFVMITRLKDAEIDGLDLDGLVAASAVSTALVKEYTMLGIDTPSWLPEVIKKIRERITTVQKKVRDDRIAELKRQRQKLQSTQEKREAVERELKELGVGEGD